MPMNPIPHSERANDTTYDGYIEAITLPSGTKYEIVDAEARNTLSTLSEYTQFLGVTTTTLADGATANPITIGSSSVTAVKGNIAIYSVTTTAGMKAKEFIYSGTEWQLFGDISADNLGTMAYTSTASGTYWRWKSTTITTATVTSTGSFTASGTVGLTKATATIGITSTATNPGAGNTANYWIYTPGGDITMNYTSTGASQATAYTSITQVDVVKSITHASPSSTTTGMLNYANVTSHVLSLNQIKPSSGKPISASSTAKVVKTLSITASFGGDTVYVKPIKVEVATAASFTGNAVSVTVASTSKFGYTIGSSTESATVKVTPST